MRKRSLTYGLTVLFFAVGAAETWSQECQVSYHRPGTLLGLFQQRLCGALYDDDCTSKSQVQKGTVAAKGELLTKTVTVQKAIPVQKACCVQKSGCRREVSDSALDYDPCGCSHPRTVADLLSRWNGTSPRLFPPLVSASPSKAGKGKGDVATKYLPRARKGCGCGPDLPRDQSELIPMIEKPQIDDNPFRDDALQPAPLRSATTRQARVLPLPSTNDPTDSTIQQPGVRHASYYLLSVEADLSGNQQ